MYDKIGTFAQLIFKNKRFSQTSLLGLCLLCIISCFIHPGVPMYLTLLAPIGLILLHNIITFILVMRSLLQVEEESHSQQISKRLQNAICISTLMGLTWVFGFLAIGDATFAFQLIFCLANSLQVNKSRHVLFCNLFSLLPQ